MTNNIVGKIGRRITVWTQDGNAMENRELLTIDTYGIVVTGCNDESKSVFLPWNRVNYVDYLNSDYKQEL